KHHHFALVLLRDPEGAQQIDSGRHRKLRSTKIGGKIPATNPTTLFQRLEHVVDRRESPRKILCMRRFAKDNAVSRKQLLRDSMTPRCLSRGSITRDIEGHRVQTPAPLCRWRRRPAAAEAALVMYAPRRSGVAAGACRLLAVRTQCVQRVIGKQATPHQ